MTLMRVKGRVTDAIRRRPNLLYMFDANTNRDRSSPGLAIQPNFDSSPLSAPIGAVPRAS